MADQIGGRIGVRVLDRIAHAGLRAEMHDALDLDAAQRGVERRPVGEIQLDEAKIAAEPPQLGEPVALQLADRNRG